MVPMFPVTSSLAPILSPMVMIRTYSATEENGFVNANFEGSFTKTADTR